MAICTPISECPICHKALESETEIIGFPDLVPMFDEFGDFYDACAHRACLNSWSRRNEFVAYFNELVKSSPLSANYRLHVLPTGQVVYERDLK